MVKMSAPLAKVRGQLLSDGPVVCVLGFLRAGHVWRRLLRLGAIREQGSYKNQGPKRRHIGHGATNGHTPDGFLFQCWCRLSLRSHEHSETTCRRIFLTLEPTGDAPDYEYF